MFLIPDVMSCCPASLEAFIASALSKALCPLLPFKCKSNALLWGSPRAWSSALLTRRLVDPVKAQAVKKFFIPFNLSAWVLHTEQFKLTTWSPLSAFITSHSLPKCSAKDVVFQRFAAATVRALVFLADGVDDTAVEGQSLVSVEALDGLQS